jgi:voltage-gated potassium channel
VDQLPEAIARNFARRRHGALLVAIIAAFAVRPVIGDSGSASSAFSFVILVVLLIAIYNINVDDSIDERGRPTARVRTRRMVGWVLAIVAGLERIAVGFIHNSSLDILGTFGWLLFFLFVTVSQFRSVLRQREITGETICMAVSVYLLAAFAWTLIYAVIFQRHPQSFIGLTTLKAGDLASLHHIFAEFGYYSLGTISTIGGGDITPVSLRARYATAAEAIMGQFYLAILVARLVGLQLSGRSGATRIDDPR